MTDPIRLDVDRSSEQVRVRVVGAADRAMSARFSLTIRAGGNQTVHNGMAALDPSRIDVLSTVTVGLADDARWHASLRVEPSDGEPYERSVASA